MNAQLWTALAAPVFGFGIGYATNALAIRMLFRPYKERRVLGLRFQGMIPRRKQDIARTVAEVVTTELLREDRVAERLAGPEVREALEGLATDLAVRYLTPGAGSWVTRPEPRRALARAVERAVPEGAAGLAEWLSGPEGRRATAGILASLLERSPAEVLPGEQGLLRRFAAGKAAELLASPGLEKRVRQAVSRFAVRLAGVERPVGELLPPEVRGAIRAAVEPLVDPLLHRFEEAVLSPANVERIKAAVRAGIVGYLAELRGGLVKNAIRRAALLARDRIFREADELVDANLFRLRELVRQEEHRERIREGILEAVDGFLGRTPGEILAGVPAEALDRVFDQVSAWAAGRLRRPDTAEALVGWVERELDRWYGEPLGRAVAVADPAAPQRWVESLVGWARDGGLARLAEREAPRIRRAVEQALASGRIPPPPREVVRDLVGVAFQRVMPVIAEQVPAVLSIVDVRGLVERQIQAFSPAEAERVILQVARRELRAITWWGGVLGAAVGGVQAGLLLLAG